MSLSKDEQLKKVVDDIDYLFSKINWNKSNLDAEAIFIMNGLVLNISNLIKEDENESSRK